MSHPEEKVLGLAWYLFRVRTNKERNVCQRVDEAGFTAAMPEVTYRVRGHWRSKKKVDRSYPALKSYILIGFEDSKAFQDGYRTVADMPFVSGVVGFESFAARLNSKQVYDFLTNGAWDKRSVRNLVEAWQPDYIKDDTVRLRGAGFDGVTGQVVNVNMESRKARVSVPFLGSEREIEVPVENAYFVLRQVA